MRLEGDIGVIRDIEQFIIKNTQYDLVKDVAHNPVCSVEIKPTNYVKSFVVYVMFFEFEIRLVYDLRSNKGIFKMPDYNSQVLFTKHPQLIALLSKMNNIQISEYSGGKQNIDKIQIKETDVKTI
jgi:hypothetical protein